MNEISVIKNSDPDFPESLGNIAQAPEKLYYRGKLPVEGEPMAAVVGSRLCTDYGRRAANDICQGLIDAGFTIVSGLTPGIDTAGHRAAVDNRRKTIAVLGTGIDRESLYPQSNLDLSEEIVDNGGCLLSEYPAGTHGAKFTFPRRNRIIAGLAMATIVVEAKIKSGSLITADLAKKFKKPVFAVPGSVYSLNSDGCNELIRQGAILARNADDILNALGWAATRKNLRSIAGSSPEETLILEAISGEALEMDKIIAKTQLPAQTVMSIVPVLEIKGTIKNIGGMKYYLNKH